MEKDGCDDHVVQDILLLVSHKVTLKEIRSWSPVKKEKIVKWAGRVHLKASDNPVRVPPKPRFVSKEIKFSGIGLW